MILGMDSLYFWILGTPLVGAAILALLPWWRVEIWVNILVSAVTFAGTLRLLRKLPEPNLLLFADEFNSFFLILTAFVGLTTSIYSAAYISRENNFGNESRKTLHLYYHPLYQMFAFAMLLALMSNNIGLMWVAVEAATLATVLMVNMYRSRMSTEAAWKYFILCSVGIGLALFGTILVYMAAQPVMGEGLGAMALSEMVARAPDFHPELLNLAFVFLLVGYGTKVGLAPVHFWLPDAHAEGPTPVSAILSGLLLNVALYALLRFKMMLAINTASLDPGPMMMGIGLFSMLVAGFMIYRRGDIKRLFAYSSIEHMGLATFAFGFGGPLATFAALLHIIMHSLIKSGIFFTVGLAVQYAGSKRIEIIRGLTVSHPLLGWTLVIGVMAITGLPPFGIFASEFLLLTAVVKESPVLAIAVLLLLLVAFSALLLRLQTIVFGTPPDDHKGYPELTVWTALLAYTPIFLHLALALVAGLFMPRRVGEWLQSIAMFLG